MLTETIVCDEASLAVLDEIKERFLEGSEGDASERRQELRRTYPYSVALQQAEGDPLNLGPPIVAAGRDVSLWGISVDSPTPFDIGDQVLITFQTVPRHDVPIVRMLSVVRHFKRNANGQLHLGCEFLETISSTGRAQANAAS